MSYSFTGNIKHSNGLCRRQGRSKKNEQRLLARRVVLAGYPLEKVFQTKEEIDNYFTGDTIVCLLCGKSYKALNAHLQVHGFNEVSYKEKYGLPYHRGLCGEATKKLHSINFKKLVAEGIIGKPTEEQIKKMRENVKHQRFQPFRRNVSIQNVMKTLDRPKKDLKFNRKKGIYEYWEYKDYEKIIELSLQENLHPFDLMKKYYREIPTQSQFRLKMKEFPELKKKYYECIDLLPFEEQAKHQQLGKRFISEIKRLKLLGYSNEKISHEIKVHEVTIEKFCLRNRITKPDKTSCINGHPYEEGLRKCRVCNTENKRKRTGSLPRNIAKITKVIVKCSNCNEETETNRLGMSRPIIYCDSCKRKFYLESQKKYKENNLERRRQMAREAYIKRKNEEIKKSASS